ncbi:acylphosphatase [Lachnoclostridium sp. An181]|uniref:acylphosphatase n=1 Tax=Lachnoclostridium sp. An181 TaxID=1965575 RepID=UPI000B38F0C4|nr:acylphosphatase [Lachnoclostridium sp. An181]OUP48728.1 acylphosphatase [Lachnoclostridium sp. An181]
MGTVRQRISFEGRVQGVGFRYRLAYLAKAADMTGWVENEYDGSVTAEIQGTEAMIDRVIERLKDDRYIRIDWISRKDIPLEEERGFRIRG